MKAKFNSPVLQRVVENDLCTGCGACAAIAPRAVSMTVIAPGFARPAQNEPVCAAQEAAIKLACPGSTLAPWPLGTQQHPYWGPYQSIMTGNATDGALRHAASSGGLISALLIHGLQSGAFDAVVQIKSDPADPTRNIHHISRTASEVMDCSGSRYSPSSPLAGLAELLDSQETFAFVGKPCDVSALRQMAKLDPRVEARFPLVLSFFCGGIPSHAGTQQILDDLGVKKDDLADFRYRGDGWPGFATATRRDGSTERMSYMDSWGGRLSKHVQFRCKICPDAVGGVADIVCADAWYGDEKGYPLFDETDGRSLVIGRTEVGQKLLDAAAASGAIVITPSSAAEIDKMQPSQARRKRLALSRFVAMVACFHPVPTINGIGVSEAARRAGLVETVKSFLGLVRRIVMGRK